LNRKVLFLNFFKLINSVPNTKIKLILKSNEAIAMFCIVDAGTSHAGPSLFNKTIHIINRFEIKIPIADLYI
jgi:hypothetical protein